MDLTEIDEMVQAGFIYQPLEHGNEVPYNVKSLLTTLAHNHILKDSAP
jgi:hypothetical protein